MDLNARRRRHERLGVVLAGLTDEEVSSMLARAGEPGHSIGGTTRRLVVEGEPVFAKGIRLTDLESGSAGPRPTANVFGLPTVCHYGIGSPGFGVWRELAAHTETTELVLTGATSSFPLMYHWRVLPCERSGLADELSDVEAAVRFWEGSDAVRQRITALAAAERLVWVFMEHFDATLNVWWADQLRRGPAALSAACDLVERELRQGLRAMTAAGLLHLDLHFDNIVTDGRHLYFADLGLAMSDAFDLDPAERVFAAEHRDYDRSYAVTQLVRWLTRRVLDTDPSARTDYPRVADLVARYQPVADVVVPFYLELQNQSRHARYPRRDEVRAWSGIAF